MADRSARLLRRLTGDGDDLDDLLGAEGGRGARPGGVAEHLRDQAQQLLLRGLVLLGAPQSGGGLEPAVPPQAHGQPRQFQASGHGLDAGLGRQRQEEGGPADQTLVGGLPPPQALEQGLLGRGNLDSNCLWSAHGPARSATPGRFPWRPYYAPQAGVVSDFCHAVLVEAVAPTVAGWRSRRARRP